MVDITPADELEAVKLACYTLSNSDDAGEMKAAFDEISIRCTDYEKREQSLSVLLETDSPKNMLHALQKWMTSQYVIAQGLSAIHNSALSDEMAHQFVHHQGIEIIVECMNKYTENIFLQTRGCGCLGILIKASSEQNDTLITSIIPLIKQHDIGTMMIKAMDLHPDDAKLHRWAMKSLDIITDIKELMEYYINETKVLEGIVRGYCRCQQLHKNDTYMNDIAKFAWSSILHFQPQTEQKE
jgi:hypothetical protein